MPSGETETDVGTMKLSASLVCLKKMLSLIVVSEASTSGLDGSTGSPRPDDSIGRMDVGCGRSAIGHIKLRSRMTETNRTNNSL